MAATKRATIIETIVAALKNITIVNGFRTNIGKVVRGIRNIDDFLGDLPAISVWNERNVYTDSAMGTTKSILTLHFWGFVKAKARHNDYTELDNLAADVEQLLMDSTYNPYITSGLTFLLNTTFYEGGVVDNFGIFDMIAEIHYFYPFNQP